VQALIEALLYTFLPAALAAAAGRSEDLAEQLAPEPCRVRCCAVLLLLPPMLPPCWLDHNLLGAEVVGMAAGGGVRGAGGRRAVEPAALVPGVPALPALGAPGRPVQVPHLARLHDSVRARAQAAVLRCYHPAVAATSAASLHFMLCSAKLSAGESGAQAEQRGRGAHCKADGE